MSEAKRDELRYEQTDARAGALFRFAVLLTVAVGLAAAAAWGLIVYMKGLEQRHDPPPPPLARRQPGQLPPEPRLQTRPMDDLRTIRDEEERALRSYGWVDRPAGIVHIDIDQAMKLLAERGLSPAPAARPNAVAAPAAAPSAAPPPSPGGAR